MDVFFTSPELTEVFIYGFAGIFIIVFLFIFQRMLKHSISGKIKGSERAPIAMNYTDLDKLKESGELTEEEYKRLRRAIAEKIVDRTRAEQRLKNAPGKADAYFHQLEAEIKARGAAALEDQTDDLLPPQKPLSADTVDSMKETVYPQVMAPEENTLPPRLRRLLSVSEFELEDMMEKGFLSEEDYVKVVKARNRGGQ